MGEDQSTSGHIPTIPAGMDLQPISAVKQVTHDSDDPLSDITSNLPHFR